jgi:hypothetical protein
MACLDCLPGELVDSLAVNGRFDLLDSAFHRDASPGIRNVFIERVRVKEPNNGPSAPTGRPFLLARCVAPASQRNKISEQTNKIGENLLRCSGVNCCTLGRINARVT